MEMAATEGWRVADNGYMVGAMMGEDGKADCWLIVGQIMRLKSQIEQNISPLAA
jgi:hypothetical protein